MGKAPTTAEIIDELKDHVWTLICAGQIEAAMILLDSRVNDFLAAFEAELPERQKQEAAPEVEVGDTPTMILPRQLAMGTAV